MLSEEVVKKYNKFYIKANKARSFISCINHALDKSDDNARKQFECIGWSNELRDFLSEAIECYVRQEHNKVVSD